MNGRQVIEEISRVTKFSTKVLTQAEEARYGSLGIASSCHGLASLTMDLGGGSCQLGWVVSDIDSQPDGNGGVSLPYGAAELSRLIKGTSVLLLFAYILHMVSQALSHISRVLHILSLVS